jgi:hypothetical protein
VLCISTHSNWPRIRWHVESKVFQGVGYSLFVAGFSPLKTESYSHINVVSENLVTTNIHKYVAYMYMINMAVCQNLVPLLNIKIAGKWMFIPLKMVLIGIDPYPYYGTCAIATVRENGHLPGREQLRVSRTSTLEGFVVVRVNASKSNVLMVQAVRTLHSKINFKNFQPGILPIQDPFLISYILC